MPNLIKKLKREHSKIVARLNEVLELGILSEGAQAKLMPIKALLLEHLQNENEQIYLVLWKEAEHNKDLNEILNLFALEMQEVSNVVQQFFNKFHEGTVDKNFQHDFEVFFSAIAKRIENEEEILYDEYKKIAQ